MPLDLVLLQWQNLKKVKTLQLMFFVEFVKHLNVTSKT